MASSTRSATSRLAADTIRTLRITDDELAAFRFCARDEAAELLRPYVWQRAESALDALSTGRARYFDGSVPAAVSRDDSQG